MFNLFKQWKRRRILAEAFPASHLKILEEKFPLYRRLPEAQQAALRARMQVFLSEKQFEGSQGFEIDTEVRVLIAAQACLLLIGNEDREYHKLKSILVYPRHYQAHSESAAESGVVTVQEQSVLGQSWEHGLVALSWQSSEQGAANMKDGRNVVIHEFAHQLDQETGVANGLPVLRSRCRYEAWQRVLSKEYERLQDRVDRGRKTVMDAYGATHPAEFFAVASECFFEKPKQLKEHRPDLYRELQIFYGQDPVTYH